MYCTNCRKEIPDGSTFCPECGKETSKPAASGLVCPKCGSNNIDIQLHQEETGSQTTTKTKSKYKETGHGLIWWICIGSWWWIIDLTLWICFFPIKLVTSLTKKKKYKGQSTSVASTTKTVSYKSICLCKNCGYNWEKK